MQKLSEKNLTNDTYIVMQQPRYWAPGDEPLLYRTRRKINCFSHTESIEDFTEHAVTTVDSFSTPLMDSRLMIPDEMAQQVPRQRKQIKMKQFNRAKHKHNRQLFLTREQNNLRTCTQKHS